MKSSPVNPIPPTELGSTKSQAATAVPSEEIPVEDSVFEDIETSEGLNLHGAFAPTQAAANLPFHVIKRYLLVLVAINILGIISVTEGS